MQLVSTDGSIRDTMSGYKVNVYTTQSRDEVIPYVHTSGNFCFFSKQESNIGSVFR